MRRDPAKIKNMIERMRKIEGQARGIQRMLEEGRSCEDVLRQLSAMRAAINRVGMHAIGCYLESNLADELSEGGNGHKSIDEIMEMFIKFS